MSTLALLSSVVESKRFDDVRDWLDQPFDCDHRSRQQRLWDLLGMASRLGHVAVVAWAMATQVVSTPHILHAVTQAVWGRQEKVLHTLLTATGPSPHRVTLNFGSWCVTAAKSGHAATLCVLAQVSGTCECLEYAATKLFASRQWRPLSTVWQAAQDLPVCPDFVYRVCSKLRCSGDLTDPEARNALLLWEEVHRWSTLKQAWVQAVVMSQ